MSYVLLLRRSPGAQRPADAHTFKCRTWNDLAAKLVWAREEGYKTAKARRANGWVDRPLVPSERVKLVEDATQLALQ